MLIPKVLHYCWFGKGPKSQLNEECLLNWKEQFPDYGIVEWNEDNFPIEIPFLKNAYENKKFGYIIDFVRLKVLFENGGIFLDLDFKFMKSLDPFLNNKMFLGALNANEVGMGIVGSIPAHPYMKELMGIYEGFEKFVDIPSTEIATRFFNSKGYLGLENKGAEDSMMKVYSPSVFYSYPLGAAYRGVPYTDFLNEEVVGVHLWENSWIKPEFRDFWFGNIKKGWGRVVRRLFEEPLQPITYYKDLGYHLLRQLKIK